MARFKVAPCSVESHKIYTYRSGSDGLIPQKAGLFSSGIGCNALRGLHNTFIRIGRPLPAHRNVFGFAKFQKSVMRTFAPEPALFHAAERRCRI